MRDTKPIRRLIASIHDVGPRFEGEADALRDRVARHVGDRIALLAVPNHWGLAPIRAGTPFAARLRGWADEGAEIFLHGWFHSDDSRHADRIARFKARHMTAGEGEFLGLDHAAASRRLADGRALLEDIIGRPVAGFVAPAWLYGPGALRAVADGGFAIAEDHMKVWRPATGAVLCRGPVITWASRSRMRMLSSLAAARLLSAALRPAPTVRIAVHPGDVHAPPILRSIDRTLGRLGRGRVASRYADLQRDSLEYRA